MSQLKHYASTLPTRNNIREFLEWLDGQKLEVARWMPNGTRMMPVIEDRERLLDRFLEVDAQQLERERLALLNSATTTSTTPKP